MLDFATIEFISVLNELSRKAKNGIKSFKEATSDNFHDFVFYDEEAQNIDGSYKIVLGACLAPEHHDAYAYYADRESDYSVGAYFFGDEEEDNDLYIEVKFTEDDNAYVSFDDGNWEFHRD